MINEEDYVMESIKFNDYVEFAKYLYNLVLSGKAVAVTAFGNEISILAKSLLSQHEVKLGYVNSFDNSDYTDYKREYYLALDTNMELSIERVFDDDNRMFKGGLDVGCYMSDVHSKIAINNDDDIQYEIEIENECCDTCGCRLGADDEDDDIYDNEDDDLIITDEDTPMLLYMICEMLNELLDEIKE